MLSPADIQASTPDESIPTNACTHRQAVITLTPAEQLLREFLLDCARGTPGLDIWVTGGWVRDRLLGIPSSDLDFGLSNLTGKQFGEKLEEFAANPAIVEKYRQRASALGLPQSTVSFSPFHTVDRNTAAAKRLETAGGKLFGLEVDLVNLRKEVYDGSSRNPEMQFGTAEEDAFRRDATVNALFFHLKEQRVADFTGKGLQDMRAKLIRTPLKPRQTFMDDPLRILRLIRIGSKLNFSIDAEALRCMKNQDVQRSLDTIITRDRIHIELFKMLDGPSPEVALQYIYRTGLYAPVFLQLESPLWGALQSLYAMEDSSYWPGCRPWSITYQTLAHVLESKNSLGRMIRLGETSSHLWIMAAYSPLANVRARFSVTALVDEVTHAIKAPTKLSRVLEQSLVNYDSIHRVVDNLAKQEPDVTSRSTVGMAMRRWGTSWVTQVTMVMLSQVLDQYHSTTAPSDFIEVVGQDQIASVSSPRVLEKFEHFAAYVFAERLQDAPVLKPLLDGHAVQKLLNQASGGKYIKAVLELLLAWQFNHEDATPEQAKDWLLALKTSGKLPVALPCQN